MTILTKTRRGITRIEVVILVVIAVGLLVLAAVFVPQTVEKDRAMRCKANLAEIGEAIILYDEQNMALPQSNMLNATGTGKVEGEGWSWAYEVTPFMGRADLHPAIDLADDEPRDAQENVEVIAAADAEVFRCPSFVGSHWVKKADATPWRSGDRNTPRSMISHYKALAATTDESLQAAYATDSTVGYNEETHPDGAINPETSYAIDSLTDGATSTILLGETIEPFQSRWLYGDEMEMVAMDQAKVNISDDTTGDFVFAYPAGFNPRTPRYGTKSEIPTNPADGTGQPLMAYNYSGTTEAPTYHGVQTNNADAIYGPSSSHPEVVHHVLADNSIRALSKKIDAAAYMFYVTRASGDPSECQSPGLIEEE